jgi:hypothetical protein
VLATLSAPTFDLSGYVEIDVLPEASFTDAPRRVNRVKTLDGGAVINDGGFSDADRTITLRWRPTSETQESAVERMLRLYSLITVSVRAGVFEAAPELYSPGPNESTLRLLVLSKLSD